MPAPRDQDTNVQQAALEKLAAALDSGEYATTLVTSHGQPPRLTVVSRQTTALAENIGVREGCFWWSWAERVAPITDVATAAAKVATVLRAAPQPVPW